MQDLYHLVSVWRSVNVCFHFLLPVSLQRNIFKSAVIFPRHVEGQKLDRTVWSLSTFHAYVSYHVKVGVSFASINVIPLEGKERERENRERSSRAEIIGMRSLFINNRNYTN